MSPLLLAASAVAVTLGPGPRCPPQGSKKRVGRTRRPRLALTVGLCCCRACVGPPPLLYAPSADTEAVGEAMQLATCRGCDAHWTACRQTEPLRPGDAGVCGWGVPCAALCAPGPSAAAHLLAVD